IGVAGETLTLNGPGFNNAGALENASGHNFWSKGITLGSDSYIGSTTATDGLTIDQPISDGGNAFGVTKVGPGQLEYAAGNTYTGLTQVNDGTLQLNNGPPNANAIAGN